jgi:hypothetical protein
MLALFIPKDFIEAALDKDFEIDAMSMLGAHVIGPIVETITFNLLLPFILYIFNTKRYVRIALCTLVFSASHSPPFPSLYLFYAVIGFYLAYCSDYFMFERNNVKSAFIYTFSLHFLWNLSVTFYIFLSN